MRMEIKPLESRTENVLIISNRDRQLVWNIPQKDLSFNFDVFEQINGYWAQCRQQTQDDIFEIYEKIYWVFENIQSFDTRVSELRPLIADLMDYHPQEDIYVWAWSKANIVVPSGVHTVFDASRGMAGTPERTYLEHDYRQLVALSISLRAMFPIWRKFTNDSRAQAGTIFKETQAYQLMALSNVFNCPAMERFTVFVTHTLPRDRHSDAAILQGISSADIQNWVLSAVVVTKLCCGDVRGINPNAFGETNTTAIPASLPAFLYNSITQRLRSLESNFGNITPKFSGSTSADGDNNLSKIEGFKMKIPVALANIEAISVYLDIQMQKALTGIGLTDRSLVNRMSRNPEFVDLVKMSFESVKALENARLTKEQVTIATWVMKPYVSPRSIPNLTKKDILKIIAFAQAYLWDRRHYELAALCSAIVIENNDIEASIMADRREAIDKDDQLELISRFKFNRRTSSRSVKAKSYSPVVNTIMAVTAGLSNFQWRMTLPDAMITQARWDPLVRIIRVPAEIRSMLARLIIDIDKITPLPPVPEHHSRNPAQLSTDWANV